VCEWAENFFGLSTPHVWPSLLAWPIRSQPLKCISWLALIVYGTKKLHGAGSYPNPSMNSLENFGSSQTCSTGNWWARGTGDRAGLMAYSMPSGASSWAWLCRRGSWRRSDAISTRGMTRQRRRASTSPQVFSLEPMCGGARRGSIKWTDSNAVMIPDGEGLRRQRRCHQDGGWACRTWEGTPHKHVIRDDVNNDGPSSVRSRRWTNLSNQIQFNPPGKFNPADF
jgi:hypothetical protein